MQASVHPRPESDLTHSDSLERPAKVAWVDLPARLVLLTLLAVLPLLAMWVYSAVHTRMLAPALVQGEAQEDARAAADAVRTELLTAAAMLRGLATSAAAPCPEALRAGDWPDGIGVFAPDGALLCGSAAGRGTEDGVATLAGQDVLRAALLSDSARPVLAGVPAGWITGRPATVAALRLPPVRPGGPPSGVLAMGLPMHSLHLSAPAPQAPGGAHPDILVLDGRDLTVLATVPDRPDMLGRRLALPALLADSREDMLAGAVRTRGADNTARILGWTELRAVMAHRVLVAVSLPGDAGMAAADQALWATLELGALAVASGMVVAWMLLGRGVTQAIRDLLRGRREWRRLPPMLAALAARLATHDAQHAEWYRRLEATRAELAQARAELRRVSDGAGELFETLGADLSRHSVRGASEELLGYDAETLAGRTLQQDRPPEDWERLHTALDALAAPGAVARCEMRVRRRDGGLMWLETRLCRLEDGGVLMVSRDVSRRRRAEDRLAEAERRLATLALEDALTGLANQRRFDDALAQELRRATRMREPLGLVLIELDQFAGFRDRYGHVRGDAALRRVARAMAGSLRRPGDLAARLQDDRLAVLLPGADAPGAQLVGERMLAAIRALQLPDMAAPGGVMTGSAGTASLSPGAGPVAPAALVAGAEAALATARRAGRNRIAGVAPADPPHVAIRQADHTFV